MKLFVVIAAFAVTFASGQGVGDLLQGLTGGGGGGGSGLLGGLLGGGGGGGGGGLLGGLLGSGGGGVVSLLNFF